MKKNLYLFGFCAKPVDIYPNILKLKNTQRIPREHSTKSIYFRFLSDAARALLAVVVVVSAGLAPLFLLDDDDKLFLLLPNLPKDATTSITFATAAVINDPKTAPYAYGLFASCRTASNILSNENTFLLFIVFPHTICEDKTTAGFMYPHEYLHFSTVITKQ